MNEGLAFHAERAEPYYPRDDQHLIAFTLSHAEMVARFGPAHRPMDSEDNEAGPVEYWSFRFPCGLVTFITYHFSTPTGPCGVVTSSSPDIGHILQHLPIAAEIIWRLDHDEPDFYQQRYAIASGTCPLSVSKDRFSAKRVGYVLAALSFALLPIHFYVPCQISGSVAGCGTILFLATSVLSLFVPGGTSHRFRPLALAFIAFMAHSLFAH